MQVRTSLTQPHPSSRSITYVCVASRPREGRGGANLLPHTKELQGAEMAFSRCDDGRLKGNGGRLSALPYMASVQFNK
jgi:hypothetical protein